MTTVGMLILINSGTSLSALQPEVKKITMIITALFTFVFPASMIIMLYLTKMIKNIDLHDRAERTLPITLTIILYLFTFFIMRGIPQLTAGHIVFLFCPPLALFIVLVLNRFMKPSIHMLGVGILTGIILVIMIFYGARIQLILIATILASGILGTSRLLLKTHQPIEILAGFLGGFLTTSLVMIIYIL